MTGALIYDHKDGLELLKEFEKACLDENCEKGYKIAIEIQKLGHEIYKQNRKDLKLSY